MSTLERYKHDFRKISPNLMEWHNELTRKLDLIETKLGGLPISIIDDPASVAQNVGTPAAATFETVGIDGKFVTFITNPQSVQAQSMALARAQFLNGGGNFVNTPILHNLQSATDLNFDQNSSLKDYGTSSQLMWTDQDPNVTRFFRLRSSYDGKTWNAWQTYSNALTCGPIGVWSGLLRSAALTYLNSTAMTSDGSIAISQSGTSTVILIAAKTWNVGPQQIAYLGGSVDPGAYGTYYIYGVDTEKQGGAITYLATQNLGDLASQDGIIQFGSITTVMGGGGTGGHGGFCPVGEVEVEMLNGGRKPARSIKAGDVLRAPDGGPEIAQADAEVIPAQPCFAFTLENNVAFRGASSPELIRSNGHWVKLVSLAVGDVVDTSEGQSKVKSIRFLGECTVYRLRLDRTKRFIGDTVILHNMKIGP